MSDEADLRERALRTLLGYRWCGKDDREWALSACGDAGEAAAQDRGFLYGYLAGAREEEAIKDAEIKDKVNEHIEAASLRHLAEEKLRAEINSILKDQAAEDYALRNKLSSVLSRVAIALKGPEPELRWWSWHDLPELVEKLKKRVDSLETAIRDFLCECALIEKLRKYETYQITTGSMDELRKAVD